MEFGTKVRMARTGMDMTASDFAALCGLSVGGLLKIETLENKPNSRTAAKVERALNARGWKLIENGVVQEDQVIVIYDDYVDVLEDILHTLQEGEEVLFHRADDRRSSPAVLAKMAELKAKGIRCKSTICVGNTFITGNLDDYRQIDKAYFEDSDEVEAVFGDKYMIHERLQKAGGTEENRYFVIKSPHLSATKKKDFYYWWRNGQCLTS